MQPRRATSLVALLALAGGAGYLLAHERGVARAPSQADDKRATSQAPASSGECMALAQRHGQQIAQLQAALVRLRAQPASHAPEQQDDDEQGATPANTAPAVDPFVAHVEELETRFVEEPPDARWNAAPSVRSKANAALPVGSQLRELSCRSSLCRLETFHADRESYRHFIEQGFGKLDDPANIWPGAATFSFDDNTAENGGIVAVAYLRRAP